MKRKMQIREWLRDHREMVCLGAGLLFTLLLVIIIVIVITSMHHEPSEERADMEEWSRRESLIHADDDMTDDDAHHGNFVDETRVISVPGSESESDVHDTQTDSASQIELSTGEWAREPYYVIDTDEEIPTASLVDRDGQKVEPAGEKSLTESEPATDMAPSTKSEKKTSEESPVTKEATTKNREMTHEQEMTSEAASKNPYINLASMKKEGYVMIRHAEPEPGGGTSYTAEYDNGIYDVIVCGKGYNCYGVDISEGIYILEYYPDPNLTTDVVIPEQIGGFPVMAIENLYQGAKNIRTIRIPASLRYMNKTFAGCKGVEYVEIAQGSQLSSLGKMEQDALSIVKDTHGLYDAEGNNISEGATILCDRRTKKRLCKLSGDFALFGTKWKYWEDLE